MAYDLAAFPNLKNPYSGRFAIKIVGASGQGINTVGEILGKALKRSGYYVFAYREYPSLIKGGHATYQIDFSDRPVNSSTLGVDLVLVLNRQHTIWHLPELKPKGVILHDIGNPRINQEEAELINKKELSPVFIPAFELAREVGGNELTTNIVSLGLIWELLGLEQGLLEEVVRETFADKPKFVDIDVDCVGQGYGYSQIVELPLEERLERPGEISGDAKRELHQCDLNQLCTAVQSEVPNPNGDTSKLRQSYLITGNETLAFGAITGGVRNYYAYPMTPSSSILGTLANTAAETGMIVKQAEGEITAAAMTIGSMHAGTRALTGTSGGGFDLMTEHISLAGIIETPFVCVLAQRPGPATGMPTWTAQGDLLLAIYGGHGEFPRCVMTVRDAESAFYTIQEALNIAEKYQTVVIVLTDKLIAETLYTVEGFDQTRIPIDRGMYITDETELDRLKPTDRFQLTDSGVSKRWALGASEADFNANSDEHDEEGNLTEDAEPAAAMISKRLRKQTTLAAELPEPELLYNDVPKDLEQGKLRLIGWGGVLGVVNDLFKYYEQQNIKVDYLDIKYLWPLSAKAISDFLNPDQSSDQSSIPDSNPEALLIENNATGQLGQVIKAETGIEIPHKLLKWDGRPFFLEEVVDHIENNNLIQRNQE